MSRPRRDLPRACVELVIARCCGRGRRRRPPRSSSTIGGELERRDGRSGTAGRSAAGEPKLPRDRARACESDAAGLEPSATSTATRIAAAAATAATRLPRSARRPRRVGPAAEVGDDEQEHDHHRAGVDEHLRRGEELGATAAGRAPPARRGSRSARAPSRTGSRSVTTRDPRPDARDRRREPDDPDEDVAGARGQDERSRCSW